MATYVSRLIIFVLLLTLPLMVVVAGLSYNRLIVVAARMGVAGVYWDNVDRLGGYRRT